jgi:hypothetical protein
MSTSSSTSGSSSSAPVLATKSLPILNISPGKVSWSQEQDDYNQALVYVLIQQLPHFKWTQVTQTTSTWARVPKTLWDKLEFGVRNVRVLVVSPKGLVAIYTPRTSPISTTMPTSTSTIDEQTWSQMMKVDENYPQMQKEQEHVTVKEQQEQEEHDDEESSVVLQEDVWDLRRLSLIHQKSLVIAELAWDPVKSLPDQEYLITWELDGGGLKGHLVTDSTTVSLSLWPDTLYHIQVCSLFIHSFAKQNNFLHNLWPLIK